MTNKIENANLERDLLRALPPALHPYAPTLAALIAEVLTGRMTPAAAEQRLATDPMLTTLFQALAGQSLVGGMITVQQIESDPVGMMSVQGSATIRIVSTGGGDYAEGHIDKRLGSFVDLHLYMGEPPVVRRQRVIHAQSLVVDEILMQISNLDARLAFIAVTQTADVTEQRLTVLRRKIAPATMPVVAVGYRQLIATQNVAALRQALNSRPLATRPGAALTELQIESSTHIDGLTFFYDQLAQVQDATESLLTLLTEITTRGTMAAENAAYEEQRIDLAMRVLHNRSQMGHIAGLRTLRSLEADEDAVQTALAMLQHLEPRQLVDATVATQLLGDCLNKAATLMAERATLTAQAEQLLEQSFDAYAQIEEILTIQPSDPWHVVVGKARSLRDLGRIADAVAAFGRYADMFGTSDPAATAYARIAQQFTLQSNILGVVGGAYINAIAEGGTAQQAGLAVGDIVIGYGDQLIAAMPDLVAALQETSVGLLLRVTYLRIDEQGRFVKRITTIRGGPPGAGFMPA